MIDITDVFKWSSVWF